MRILDIKNGKLEITPEALGLKYFKTLWTRDKSKDKTKAYNDILYVYYYCDFKSPFFKYPPEEREILIKEEVLNSKDYKIDKDVLSAIDGYSEISKTPIMKMLEGASVAIYNMRNHLVDKNIDPDTAQKIIINLPKMIAALNEANEAAQRELSAQSRVRGNQQISLLEQGEI